MALVNAQEAATYVSVFRKAADNLAEGWRRSTKKQE